MLSICFCLALALVSHSFRDKRKWQIAFTTDACSESRENNCFHATRQGLLPALILDWLDKCRLLHLYALDSVGLAIAEDQHLAVAEELRSLFPALP